MAVTIKHRLTKKNKDYWEVCEVKTGKILRGFHSEDEAKSFAASRQKHIDQEDGARLKKILTWPDEMPDVGDGHIRSDVENRKPWQSVNFAIAKTTGLLQTSKVASYLGVSEAWVRKNILYSEWHHSYKQKGDGGKAFFYHPDHVLSQILADKTLYERLIKLSAARIKKLLGSEDSNTESLVPGWKRKIDAMRTEEGGLAESGVRAVIGKNMLLTMTGGGRMTTKQITTDTEILLGDCGDAWKLVSMGDPYNVIDHRPYYDNIRTPVGMCTDAPLLVLYPERGAVDWPVLLCCPSGEELQKGYCASGAEIYTIYLSLDNRSRLEKQGSVTLNEIKVLHDREQEALALIGKYNPIWK